MCVINIVIAIKEKERLFTVNDYLKLEATAIDGVNKCINTFKLMFVNNI